MEMESHVTPRLDDTTNANIRQIGEQIFRSMEQDSGSIFNKDWWYGRIMEWSMKNEHFKTQMFRFVDVLPTLQSGSDVARHLKEYFAESGDELPSVFNFGLGLGGLAPSLLAGAVKKNVEQMAKMFITGQNMKEALTVLKKSRANNLAFTVDLLGEATLSETEALSYQKEYLSILETLTNEATQWTHQAQIDSDAQGPIPKVNVSVKMTSLYSQVDPQAWEHSLQILKERMWPIYSKAMERDAFINLDMEQYAYKDLTLELFKRILSDDKFKHYPHFGTVIQCYLRDSYQDIEQLIAFAKKRGTPLTIRLVKGAYWDYETIHAEQMGWPVPVYLNKQESDANYERCTQLILQNYPHVRLAMGSHNVRSIAAGIAFAEKLGLSKHAYEIQMLYGMADPIKRGLVSQGFRVREYATVGELIPGMAYLVRRLLENTSNQSFLRSKFADNIPIEKLLDDPRQGLTPSSAAPKINPALFQNEPNLDFAIQSVREKMIEALKQTSRQIGQTVPLVIGKKEIKTSETLPRVNPSHPEQVVCHVSLATREHAEQAVQEARNALPAWKNLSANERADKIDKLADLILQKRYSLTALEILEVGKTWREADGDITEAIDFCRFYAREMRRLGAPHRVGHAPGETSHLIYVPKGIAVVIAPWNFPLAILTGMVTAALVTGNAVIMKPAEQSSLIGHQLMLLAKEAGIPAGVLQSLPGKGEEVGEALTSNPHVDLIAFTGSRAVGLHIFEKTAKTLPGQRGVKKCIIEMGGKNALIVDTDADLDEAVEGVLYSAFGFQGQKCSALSRLIVLDGVYDRFVERLVEAAKSLHVEPSENPTAYLGPVVDLESQTRILNLIEQTEKTTPLLFKGKTPETGYFVPPTIFGPVDPSSGLAQEEIFGPVLAVIRVKDLDEALRVANGTAYGLTGGVFSRSPGNIERVKRELEVGNIYVNRGITGAMVDRHPFGGMKMSGVGAKTGGPDYLLQFTDAKVVTENTLRRGFAPAEE